MKYNPTILFLVALVCALPRYVRTAHANGCLAIEGKASIDLGTFPAYEKRTASFTLRNIGHDALDILKVRHSCGCATSLATPARVPPGGTTTVSVTTIANSLTGPFDKIAYVESTDPMQPVIKLAFKGKAVPLVTITPSPYQYIPRLSTNTSWQQVFTLTPSVAVRLGEPVVTGANEMTATLSPPAKTQAPRTLAVRLAPCATAGRIKNEIVIPVMAPTNHPPLKLVIAGKSGNELYAIPHRVTVNTAGGEQTLRFRLRVVTLHPDRVQADTLTWPTIAGVAAQPLQAGFIRNQLPFQLTLGKPFLDTLKRDGTADIHIAMPGATPARITCSRQ